MDYYQQPPTIDRIEIVQPAHDPRLVAVPDWVPARASMVQVRIERLKGTGPILVTVLGLTTQTDTWIAGDRLNDADLPVTPMRTLWVQSLPGTEWRAEFRGYHVPPE